MKKSCRRLLLLSLSIASSIQQGGASEPGAQPGQTGASAKHGGVGVGRRMQDGGWCQLGGQLWLWALRVVIQRVALPCVNLGMKVLLQWVDKAMLELGGGG